jgi:hypothetical protein
MLQIVTKIEQKLSRTQSFLSERPNRTKKPALMMMMMMKDSATARLWLSGIAALIYT